MCGAWRDQLREVASRRDEGSIATGDWRQRGLLVFADSRQARCAVQAPFLCCNHRIHAAFALPHGPLVRAKVVRTRLVARGGRHGERGRDKITQYFTWFGAARELLRRSALPRLVEDGWVGDLPQQDVLCAFLIAYIVPCGMVAASRDELSTAATALLRRSSCAALGRLL